MYLAQKAKVQQQWIQWEKKYRITARKIFVFPLSLRVRPIFSQERNPPVTCGSLSSQSLV
jgi:hypothetical protein